MQIWCSQQDYVSLLGLPHLTSSEVVPEDGPAVSYDVLGPEIFVDGNFLILRPAATWP